MTLMHWMTLFTHLAVFGIFVPWAAWNIFLVFKRQSLVWMTKLPWVRELGWLIGVA